LAGDLADCDSMFALKELMTGLGSPNLDCRQDGATYDVSQRCAYVMNSGISGIEQADVILLVGTNPRHEGTLVNARIRKRWLQGGLRIGLIGQEVDLTYPHRHLGIGADALADLLSGQGAFAETLTKAKNPLIIVGAGLLTRPDGAALQRMTRLVAEKYNMVRSDWNGYNVLQNAASRVGGLDMGFLPQAKGRNTRQILSAAAKGEIAALYLLGADEIDTGKLGNCFVVYQGHHGDRGAHRADVILPGATYTEKTALYVNTEGRPQLARQAAFPPGEAREDWKIIRALAAVLGVNLAYDTQAQLQAKMVGDVGVSWHKLGVVESSAWTPFGSEGPVSADAFELPVENFYLTNAICRASPTMAQCVAELLPQQMHAAAE